MKFKIPGWTIEVLRAIFSTERLDSFHDDLRKLPENSTGKVVVDLLDEQGFRLIPKIPNHDLKHVVLEFEMNMAKLYWTALCSGGLEVTQTEM